MADWIKGAIKKKGALKAAAKVAGAITSKGTIKKSWLKTAAQAGGMLGKRARLAITLSRFR